MKYYLSLCCIIKNERYLEEFINYYRVIGVEHFFIYDNESDRSISDRLNNFYYNKICTVINFPGKCVQLNAYQHCLTNYGKETNWLIVCDGDEYILPKIHNSLRDFLNEYEDAHAVGINWIFFGTSFFENKQDGYLIDKYKYCSNTQDKHIKTICKPKFTAKFNDPHFAFITDPSKYYDCHRNIINGPWNNNFTTDIIQINHYFGRSVEENIEKHHRGYPDSVDGRYNPPKNLHMYNNDQYTDLICKKYFSKLVGLTRIIACNYLIYKALNPDIQHLNDINQIYDHVFEYADIEKRPLHIHDKFPRFTREIYRINYPELNHLDDLHLELHYIYNGSINNDVCDSIIKK
jgi:hypothetical protein